MRAVLLATALLGGCVGQADAGCGDDESLTAVSDMIKKATQDQVRTSMNSSGSMAAYDVSKLSSLLGKANFSLEQIRTTRDDPDSSRKFCNGNLTVSFPKSILEEINNTRSLAEVDDWQDFANRMGVAHSANEMTVSFDYSVQPTDDGDSIIAESEMGSGIVELLADIMATHLLSEEIRQANIAEQQAAAQEAAMQREMEEAQEQAAVAFAEAELAEAQAANQLASQRIRAVWDAIPEETQTQLKPLQAAWNKKTDARCTVVASSASTDPTHRKAAKLSCETEAMQNRANNLEQFAEYYD